MLDYPPTSPILLPSISSPSQHPSTTPSILPPSSPPECLHSLDLLPTTSSTLPPTTDPNAAVGTADHIIPEPSNGQEPNVDGRHNRTDDATNYVNNEEDDEMLLF
jgi:hypothetical protein